VPEAANGPLLASIDFETVIGGTTGDFVQARMSFVRFVIGSARKCLCRRHAFSSMQHELTAVPVASLISCPE